MKLQLLKWVLGVTAFASIAGVWTYGYKLVLAFPGQFIPAGASPREALATSKLGATTAEVIATVDRFGVVARDGQFWTTALRDVGEAIFKFSIAQFHRLAEFHGASSSVGAPGALLARPGLAASPPLAAPTQRSVSGVDCFDNAAADEIIKLTNAERVKVGLPPLAIDVALMTLARKRSSELVLDFSHDGLRSDCAECGENIGWRLAGSFSPSNQVSGWMASTHGHRENMLYPTARRIGVGVCRSSDGKVYSALDIMN